MIISHLGLLAAARLIIFLGAGKVDAHHWKGRQAPLSTTSSSTSPSPSPQAIGLAPSFFETEWPELQNGRIPLDTTFRVDYSVSGTVDANVQQQAEEEDQLPLILVWTNATGTSSPDSSNTWEVTRIEYICNNSTLDEKHVCMWNQGQTGSANFNLALNPEAQTQWIQNPGKFFLCFVTSLADATSQVCESYSPFFDLIMQTPSRNTLNLPRADPVSVGSLPSFTNTLPITQTTFIVTSSGTAPSTTAAPAGSYTTIDGQVFPLSLATISLSSSIVTASTSTGTPTPTPSAAVSSSKSSGGLSTGAIVGIAIGAFIVLLLALLVGFFCHRRNRRHRAQRTPEQVLLTHNMHNGSRDLVGEKSEAEGPMLGSILETRPSSGPYDHLSTSAPYNGPVGPGRLSPLPQTQQTLLPQRHPTSATVNTMHTEVSNLSRGLSDASGPIISPRPGGFEEPYHDVPIYGDARHIPQVYQGNMQAPFLSEPGMTDEELTRLEEEERRIDAAILEAEGRRL